MLKATIGEHQVTLSQPTMDAMCAYLLGHFTGESSAPAEFFRSVCDNPSVFELYPQTYSTVWNRYRKVCFADLQPPEGSPDQAVCLDGEVVTFRKLSLEQVAERQARIESRQGRVFFDLTLFSAVLPPGKDLPWLSEQLMKRPWAVYTATMLSYSGSSDVQFDEDFFG